MSVIVIHSMLMNRPHSLVVEFSTLSYYADGSIVWKQFVVLIIHLSTIRSDCAHSVFNSFVCIFVMRVGYHKTQVPCDVTHFKMYMYWSFTDYIRFIYPWRIQQPSVQYVCMRFERFGTIVWQDDDSTVRRPDARGFSLAWLKDRTRWPIREGRKQTHRKASKMRRTKSRRRSTCRRR